MKKIWIVFIAVALVCSCKQNKEHKLIAPLPCGYDVDALEDCTVPAKFTSEDFRWMGGNLTMTVYSEDFYDTVDLHMMEPGDTLLFDGEKIIVETIEEEGGLLTVNGGLEEGGAWLQPNEGGTYRAIQFDDHSLYTEMGVTQMALSDDFIIKDCGDNPTDPIVTITDGQKLYLETLEGYRKDFSPLNTRVRIENGLIVEISRHWIP